MTRHPLRYFIVTAFAALLLVIGVTMAAVTYSRSSHLLEASAIALATRSTREAGAELERVLAPVRGTVRLLALQPVAAADSLAERMRWVETFVEALRMTDTVVSYYIGYANGDFFLVRRIGQADESAFGAPPGTRFVVQSIERGVARAPPRSRFLFLDERLGRLGAAERPQAIAFDPRLRPWYAAAMDTHGVARTSPYVFFTNGKIGSTVALSTSDRRAVVAADVELDALSRMLARLRVTPSTQVLLFDAAGRLMGRDNPAANLVVREPDGAVRPALLTELGDPLLARLAGFAPASATQPEVPPLVAHVRLDGEDVMLTVARLDLDDRLPVFLGLLIPTDELLGEARTLRNQTWWVTLALIGLAIPLAFWLAHLIARPLCRLAAATEAVRRFDFGRPIAAGYTVREIDELALTLEHMRHTLGSFIEITTELAGERDAERLVQRLLEKTAAAVDADGSMLYLAGGNWLHPAAGRYLDRRLEVDTRAAVAITAAPFGLAGAIEERQPVSGLIAAEEGARIGLRAPEGIGKHVVAVPLFNRDQALLGGLLIFSRKPADSARLAFIAAVSGFAAVTIETRNLLAIRDGTFC